MQHYASFHLGLQCLSKYRLRIFRIQRVTCSMLFTTSNIAICFLCRIFYAKFPLVISHINTLQTNNKDSNVSVFYHEGLNCLLAVHVWMLDTNRIGRNRKCSTIDERRSKIVRYRVFDCHLSPDRRQMAIDKTISSDFFIRVRRLLIRFPAVYFYFMLRFRRLQLCSANFETFRISS